jgi:hypothetical protein
MSAQETEHRDQTVKRVGRCAITSEGITIAGYHLSWILILLIVVALFLLFKKDGFNSIFGDNTTVVTAPPTAFQTASVPARFSPPVESFSTVRTTPVGEISKMFGHNRW